MMRSKRLPSGNAANPSPHTKLNALGDAVSRGVLPGANASASAEMSSAWTRAPEHFTASAMARQPLPVPKSRAVEG